MRNKWLELSSNKKDFEFIVPYNGIFYCVNIKKGIDNKHFVITEISSNSVVYDMVNSGNFKLNSTCDISILIENKITKSSSSVGISNLKVVAYSTILNSKKTGLIHSIVFKAKTELKFIKKYL